jgi:hypothetical protein
MHRLQNMWRRYTGRSPLMHVRTEVPGLASSYGSPTCILKTTRKVTISLSDIYTNTESCLSPVRVHNQRNLYISQSEKLWG